MLVVQTFILTSQALDLTRYYLDRQNGRGVVGREVSKDRYNESIENWGLESFFGLHVARF